MKRFIRQKTDQSFPTMLRPIPESREYFFQKNLQNKLFRRFWRTLDGYNKGKTYNEVLQLFLANHVNVISHLTEEYLIRMLTAKFLFFYSCKMLFFVFLNQ